MDTTSLVVLKRKATDFKPTIVTFAGVTTKIQADPPYFRLKIDFSSKLH